MVKKVDKAAGAKKEININSAIKLSNIPNDFGSVYTSILSYYKENSSPRLLLIDVFLLFLVVVGIIQFAFCLLVGTFPFNAFLGGFGATVAQFILTANLRIQTRNYNQDQFKDISPERSFADYVLGSLVLHFIVYHFIN